MSLDFSHTQINFLDIKIFKESNGVLHTTIFRKETDRNTILRADSFHPLWMTENINFGQFQRLKRICDKEEDFNIRAQDMTQRFKERGYKNSVINKAYNKVRNISRDELLRQKRESQDSDNSVYFVTQYSTDANRIKKIIKSNWEIGMSDPYLREVMPESPSIAFRKAPTIKDKIVRSHLPSKKSNTWLSLSAGNYRCGNCNHCDNMVKTNMFRDVTSDLEFKIRSFINCNTSFVVYRLECPCGCFYIGMTTRKLKIRLSEHKNAILVCNPLYPMAIHYRDTNHGSPSTLKIIGIEHIPKSIRGGDRVNRLLQRESFWIYTLKATTFPGLNG